VEGLLALLRSMERGDIQVASRDLPHPSPLALEVLGARPYAYLDDAPLEERRTQAVATRRWIDPETAAQFGQLDAEAIARVCAEAWPTPESPDELHDALMSLGVINPDRDEVAALAPLMQQLTEQARATLVTVDETRFWVATEQQPMVRAAYPRSQSQPSLPVPSEYARRAWDPQDALRELLRGRLQASGPTTSAALAARLALPVAAVDAALLALESEGFVLRGQFTPAVSELEWCERRLLARIHRYTIKTLRAEIEPVVFADWMRFLLEWQGITRQPRPEGIDSLEGVVEQLEGVPIPAAAWESDVLPARLKDYDGAWLDSLCLSGRAYWVRLEPPQTASAGPVRSTPIALLTRKRRALWQQLSGARAQPPAALSAGALGMLEHLERFGASFFDELKQGAGLLPTQAESALAELVAAGLVSSDSFAGLRALLLPEDRKRKLAARGRRVALFGLEEAGRWSLTHRPAGAPEGAAAADEMLQNMAWLLLRRYGIVFRRVLSGEGAWLPPWHRLLRTYRRLEAQGHIRGGRFVAGVSGEQFALPEAVGALRAIRSQPKPGTYVSLSGADPLNLTGSVLPGTRVPAIAGNRLLLQDGVPVATYVAGSVQYLTPMPAAEQWRVRNLLLRRAAVPSEASAG
jgi:ATP-dependent Lhr-like helicase